MHILLEEQIKAIIDPKRIIRALEDGFKRDYQSTVRMPTRMHLPLPSGALFLLMPCYDSALPALGVKLVTVRTGPVESGGRVQATYVLLEPNTGKVCAIFSANYLTDIRTAAASAVATKLLARPESSTLGVFGTGRLARAHILVLPLVLKFNRIFICGSTHQRSEEFAQEISEQQGVTVEPADASKCVTESDVICTCTSSQAPLFDGTLVRPGTHLNLVGSFEPDTREVDEKVIRRARVVVDTYEGGLSEAGDLLVPLHEGDITRDHIIGDLHEVLTHKKIGRSAPNEITVFKSVGSAFEDLIAAKAIYESFLHEHAPD